MSTSVFVTGDRVDYQGQEWRVSRVWHDNTEGFRLDLKCEISDTLTQKCTAAIEDVERAGGAK